MLAPGRCLLLVHWVHWVQLEHRIVGLSTNIRVVMALIVLRGGQGCVGLSPLVR